MDTTRPAEPIPIRMTVILLQNKSLSAQPIRERMEDVEFQATTASFELGEEEMTRDDDYNTISMLYIYIYRPNKMFDIYFGVLYVALSFNYLMTLLNPSITQLCFQMENRFLSFKWLWLLKLSQLGTKIVPAFSKL